MGIPRLLHLGERLEYQQFFREMFHGVPTTYGVEIRKIPGKYRNYNRDALITPPDLTTSSYYFKVIPSSILTGNQDNGWMVWCDSDGALDNPDKIQPNPSVIIHSGGVNKYHMYWFLSGETAIEVCVRLSILITLATGGDMQLCRESAALRVPGSVNAKYNPPREVKVLRLDNTRKFTAEDLEEKFLAALVAPHYIDGERHPLTLALATIMARAGWDLDRATRTVEHLYSLNPGSDLKGKLADVKTTYTRISLGEQCSTAPIKKFLDKEKFSWLLRGLGISARDGDVIVDGEVIGKLANIERDFVSYFLAETDWRSVSGKVSQWQGKYWQLYDEQVFASEIFQVLGKTRYIKQGDQQELPATSKLAKAITGMATGQLHREPLPPADHYYLPLINGTLDLRDFTMHPTEKEHRHLWTIPIEYEEGTSSPDWERFIEEAVPDPSVRDHLQEWMGYALMAGNRWERMLWLHGASGTGKSTYIKAMANLLGPAAVAISSEKFTDYTIAQLAGTRLGICTELSPKLLRTSIVKALVSGDPVQGRHPYGKPFTMVYEGKIVWGSNELPPLDQGEGMWRRIVPIKFDTLPRQKDDNLKYKLRDQAAGILNWAILGLKRLMDMEAHGESWMLPSSAQETIALYKSASDPIVSFAEEEIDFSDPSSHVQVLEVYQRWKAWAENRGIYVRPLDPIFFQELAKVGLHLDNTYSNGQGPRVMYFRGGKMHAGVFGSFDKPTM